MAKSLIIFIFPRIVFFLQSYALDGATEKLFPKIGFVIDFGLYYDCVCKSVCQQRIKKVLALGGARALLPQLVISVQLS